MLPNTTSTKEKIIILVKENSQMTVTEMSRQLNITAMAVRRHIQMLEADGFLTSLMIKNMTGRPSKAYQLTELGENLFPKQYKQIGLDLLNEINNLDSDIIDKAMVSRHEKLVNRYRNRLGGKTFQAQISEIVKIQTELGFMGEESEPSTEERALIKQANCPYIEIAEDFPQICRLEQHFFEELLHTNNIEKISSISKGDSCCHYVIYKE